MASYGSDIGPRRPQVAGVLIGSALLLLGAGLFLLGGDRRLALRREIETSLAPEQLWTHLEAAFRDSTASRLWPDRLETLRSDGLAEGATVHSTYRTPFGESSQVYTISDYRAGQGFTYTAGPGHPLRGGGRVLVLPTEDGARLVWSAEYVYRGFSPAALFTRFYFGPRFFGELEANVRQLERQ